MRIMVTGAAGFIGYNLSRALLARGDEVVGVDDLNPYYDPKLKQARLEQLQGRNGFSFHRIDIADREAMHDTFRGEPIQRVVNLAAQAGVRYSLTDPYAYIRSNLLGHVVVSELCRHLPGFDHLVYASSSSVYGGNHKLPFAETDRVDEPVSLYGATKKADELIGHSYAHIYRLPQTGLRFFTVYGPWGRPDMAMWIFTKAIFAGEPIHVFNYGEMQRDFTYVDDIVAGVLAALDSPPKDDGERAPHRVYNIGNHRSEPLMRMIDVLEQTIGRKAIRQLEPMQPGDVPATFADIEAIERDHGFHPSTPIDIGIPKFVDWYRTYHRL